MATESSIIIGSGLNPRKLQVPLNSVSQEAHLRGTDVIVINPEDSSAGRSGLVTAMTVGAISTQIPPTPLKYRRALAVRNNSTTDVLYISFDPSVSTGNGFPIKPGESLPMDMNAGLQLWGVSNGSADIRILELS